MKRTIKILTLSCLIAVFGTSARAQSDLEKKALEIIADRYSVPIERLSVENKALVNFPILQIEASSFKITDAETGKIYPISLDRSSSEVNTEELQIKEVNIYIEENGRLEPELAELVRSVDERELIEVTFWTKFSREVGLERPSASSKVTSEEIDQIYYKLDRERSSIAEESTRQLLEILQEKGIYAEGNHLSPVVNATVPAGMLRELSLIGDVEAVYLQRSYKSDLATARPTIGAHIVHNAGNTGQDIRIASESHRLKSEV